MRLKKNHQIRRVTRTEFCITLTDGRDDIEDEVTEQYPRISPSVGVLDVQWLEELITN